MAGKQKRPAGRKDLDKAASQAIPEPQPAPARPVYAASRDQKAEPLAVLSLPEVTEASTVGFGPRLVARVFLSDWIVKRVTHPDALSVMAEFAEKVGRREQAAGLRARAGKEPAATPVRASAEEDTPAYRRARQRIGEARRILKAGNVQEAVRMLGKALEDAPEAHGLLTEAGRLLDEAGAYDLAEACFGRAVSLRPSCDVTRVNHGICSLWAGKPEQATDIFMGLLKRHPENGELHNYLGIALLERGRTGEARREFEAAVRQAPRLVDPHVNLGTLSYVAGDLKTALSHYRTAVAMDGTHVDAHQNLALALLKSGRLEEGWRHYEWRFKLPGWGGRGERKRAGKRWTGADPVDGKTVLLEAEQGLGDTIQFVRYAPLLARRGARVVLQVQEELQRLASTVEGVSSVLVMDETPPAHDFHCPLLSLPMAFGTRLETIPADVPYVIADTVSSGRWGQWFADHCPPGPRVGLVWAGNPLRHPKERAIDERRSMSLPLFRPILDLDGFAFVSLQKGAASAEIRSGFQERIVDAMDRCVDMHDTAAVVANLDLVISVDTAVAHLAGAMNKPVWLLSRFDGCWRWLTDRKDSPWYPSMTIFRQTTPDQWQPVIDTVLEALGAWTENERRSLI